ncbi:hypothetical protein QFC22_004511 [Naganishia vaughanmartiniae]|uniref:Uncharacterized protein n=1 Tax=Naganishia vaughanmartiniae TaxID=1424756 RepID=A0ACC2X0A9_9TREE|nr:hypothetical protein QFC22_004511 [Naganishia vaughanmartiniae]
MPSTTEPSMSSTDGFRRTTLHSVPERHESTSTKSGNSKEEKSADPNAEKAHGEEQLKTSRAGLTEMKAKVDTVEQEAEGKDLENSSPRDKLGAMSDSSGPAMDRRKSLFSYGYRLPDGRFRPPETEEEWNAFYQEYITDNTVTLTEKFLVNVQNTDNGVPSPLPGLPLTNTPVVLAEPPNEEQRLADVAYRYGGGNLATAFINPRPSVGRPGGAATSRVSGDSLYSELPRHPPPAAHRNSQESQLLTPVQSPADGASPAETSRPATPRTGRNQDPDIPNIAYAQFSKNRASYQSGMKVSSDRREDELDAAKPQTWGSDAAYEQRDLARLLGQSSAKVMERRSSQTKDSETESQDGRMSAPSVATAQQGMADLSCLGSQRAESTKGDVPERPRSTDLEHGSESSEWESDEAVPAEEQRVDEESFSSSNNNVQTRAYTGSGDPPAASIPKLQTSDSQKLSQQETQLQDVSDPDISPDNDAATSFSPAYRISHGPNDQATLLQSRILFDARETSRTEPVSVEPSPNQTSAENSAGPHDRSIRRVGALRHPRKRLNSEMSEDPHRIDVDARQKAEALRLKHVWEQRGHLTAPKPLPGDARRRLKAIWKLGLDRPGEEIHRSALDRYVRLAKAQDLAACIGGELELLYVHEEQKFQQIMHETSVQFLRDCLQVQHIPDLHRKREEKPAAVPDYANVEKVDIVQTDKAKGDKINLYDETCRIIGETLHATACIIIDTTCFHVFYPTSADKNSSIASKKEPTTESRTTGSRASSVSSRSSHLMASRAQTGRADEKRARNLQYDEIDRHHPQVRFLPGKRRRTDQQAAIDVAHKVGTGALDYAGKKDGEAKAIAMSAQIPTLGKWAESEEVHFEIDIPSAKDALTAFIATNLQGRRYWFERDESEDIADSINAIMPRSTSTSLSE